MNGWILVYFVHGIEGIKGSNSLLREGFFFLFLKSEVLLSKIYYVSYHGLLLNGREKSNGLVETRNKKKCIGRSKKKNVLIEESYIGTKLLVTEF